VEHPAAGEGSEDVGAEGSARVEEGPWSFARGFARREFRCERTELGVPDAEPHGVGGVRYALAASHERDAHAARREEHREGAAQAPRADDGDVGARHFGEVL
jgi:hypothetical protein